MNDESKFLHANSNIPPYNEGIKEKTPPKRREFMRVVLAENIYAFNEQGHELGRVADLSVGGLLLAPASPWARVTLVKGQQLVITVVDPASGDKTEIKVEVCQILHPQRIGLRFL